MDGENSALIVCRPAILRSIPRECLDHVILRLDEAKTGKAIKKLPTLKHLDGGHA